MAFSGVVAHSFQNVLSGNILFDISEVEVQSIVRQWSDLFEQGKNYGWPEQIEYEGLDDLVVVLGKRSVKGFEISSSFGLGGWVLAEKMDICERSAKAFIP